MLNLQKTFEIDSNSLSVVANELNSFRAMKSACLMRMIEKEVDATEGIERLIGREVINLSDFYDDMSSEEFDVKENYEGFFNEPGIPLLTIEMMEEYLKITQSKFDSDSNFLWNIPYSYKTQNDGEKDKLSEKSKNVSISNFDHIIFNIDQIGYYRVNYDTNLWKNLINQLDKNHTKIPPLNRAALIDDAFNLAIIDKIPYEIVFDLLAYIPNENHLPPWISFHENLKLIDAMLFEDNEIYANFKRFISELIEPILIENNSTRNIENSEIVSIALFWGCQMEIEMCTDFVYSSFADYNEDENSLNINIREAVLCNVIKSIDDEEEYTELMNRFLNSNGDKSNLISALACVENEDLLLILLLKDDLPKVEKNQIITESLKNHRYGSMAGIEFLKQQWENLNDQEIYFILQRVVKNFYNKDKKEAFDEILSTLKYNGIKNTEMYAQVADKKLKWLENHRVEIKNYFDSKFETTPECDLASVIQFKINSLVISFVVYSFIYFLALNQHSFLL